MQHVVIFILKLTCQEEVNMHSLKTNTQHEVHEEQNEETARRQTVLGTWFEMEHDTFCQIKVLILKINETTFLITQETLSY